MRFIFFLYVLLLLRLLLNSGTLLNIYDIYYLKYAVPLLSSMGSSEFKDHISYKTEDVLAPNIIFTYNKILMSRVILLTQ